MGADAPGQLVDDRSTDPVQQLPQRMGPRGVGHVLDARTADDERRRTTGGELLEQPGLADAGLAADQDERSPSRRDPVERHVELTERTLASDQVWRALATHDRRLWATCGKSATSSDGNHAVDHYAREIERYLRTVRVANSSGAHPPA